MTENADFNLRRLNIFAPFKKKRKNIYQIIEENHRTAFGIAFFLEMLPVVISLVLWANDYTLFPIDFDQVPMNLRSDKSFTRYASWSTLPSFPEEMLKDVHKNTLIADHLQVMFQGDNVLSKESLTEISKIEKWLTNIPEWRSQIQTPAGDLVSMSILMFFNGTMGSDFNDSDLNDIPATLSKAYASGYNLEIDTLVAKDAVISKTVATSKLTRTVFYIARNEKYNSIDFWNKFFVDKLDFLATNGQAGLTINYMNERLYYKVVTDQVYEDFKLIFASLAFIVIVVYIHTQSIFLTTTGLFSIFASFLWTNLIYRVALNYKYFGIFHVMSVFIILGIGTDDLFVFYDTWRVALCMNLNKTYKRFSFCYSNASLSMFITSVTTALAFATNFFTPLFAIKSFSIFTSILVMINYVSAITFFPMCVLFYYKELISNQEHEEPNQWSIWQFLGIEYTSVKTPNFLVKFFRNQMFELVTHRVFKWILIGTLTANAALFSVMALKLEVSKTGLQYLITEHQYEKARRLERFGFKRRLIDNRIKVHWVFGIKELDTSVCDSKDYKCLGNVTLDKSLDLNPVDAQLALLDVCHSLTTMNFSSDNRLIRDKNGNQVSCFISHMDTFFKMYSHNMSAKNINVSIPITGIKYQNLTLEFTDVYNPRIREGDFYRFFETAIVFWLTSGYGTFHQAATIDFASMVGLEPVGADFVPLYGDSDGFGYGHRLIHFVIVLQTDIQIGYVDYKEGLKGYDAWENVTNSMMAKLPPSVQGFQVATKMEWHYFRVSENLLYNAKRGIILGTAIAFIVLIISTGNVILSLLATIDILLVVVTFAGFIHLIGWTISVIESINLALVTGLSVDFVVHLSESYHHAPHISRKKKIRDTMELMCPPILFGCITTAGASAFMLPAKIYFFFQFGVFIVTTISLSLLYSFFWFLPMLSVFGPVGETGSVQPLFTWIWRVLTWFWNMFKDREKDRRMSYSKSLSINQEAFDAQPPKPSSNESVEPPEGIFSRAGLGFG